MKYLTNHVTEWLIVILLFVLITLIFTFSMDSHRITPSIFSYIFNPYPYSIIISIDTISAIGIFSGDEPLTYQIDGKTLSMLLNVILYLILGPYLLFKGYNKAKETADNKKPWYWFLGGLIVLFSVSSMPIVISQLIIFENSKEQSMASENLDKMRSELFDVSFEIAQYEIVQDGINPSFTMDDLELKNLEYNYSIDAIESDTLVRITATSSAYEDHKAVAEIKPYNRQQIRLIR